jgi:antitoxin ParD1/3/4
MTVTLSAKQQAFVDEQVASGRFPDADAVLDEALRVLALKQDEAKMAALMTKFDEAEAEVAAGKCIRGPINARQMLEEIRQRRGQS